MGTYNHTSAQLQCPRCGSVDTFVVDLYFGNTSNMVAVPIGTQYPFSIGREPHKGGPLTDENPKGLGYTECQHCGKDFHCAALIQNGVLVSIYPDKCELPLIPDRESRGELRCPECNSLHTRLQSFNGFALGKLICDVCSSVNVYHEGDRVSLAPDSVLVRNG